MTLTLMLTVIYLVLFQACAVPAMVRIMRRSSSEDCSVWREWMVLAGVSLQGVVMVRTGAAWPVLVSPIASGVSVMMLLVTVLYYRAKR